MAPVEKSHLVLGWRTTATLEPAYWLEGAAKPGLQLLADLVVVPTESIACHTAVVAQSGSGKSFFLGRLVEEIIIRTKSRCVILDPNADFRRVHEIEDPSLWRSARYETYRRRGKLPHEKSRSEFESVWRRSNVRVRTGERVAARAPYESLQVSWPSLSMDVLAEDIDPMLRTDLYHCHTFVQELAELHDIRDATPVRTRALIDEAEQFLRQARTVPETALRSTLEVQYNASDIVRDSSGGRIPPYLARFVSGHLPSFVIRDVGFMKSVKSMVTSRVGSLIDSLVRAPQYVSPAVEHFYFSKARSYVMSGVITPEIEKARLLRRFLRPAAKRLEVVDLPSLKDQPTRLLAINAIMATEWNYARALWSAALHQVPSKDMRVPTFVVIDEAHNLIPAEPRTKAEAAVREIFRTVVLDPLVLSECENKCIMKLSSGSVLTMTRSLLGLDDIHPKMLERCLEFDPGRGLLVGRWAAGGPQFFYCAARRTVEGGRNLRDEHWASAVDLHAGIGVTAPRRRVARKRKVRRKRTS